MIMDDLDAKIISLLQKNGRMSFSKIAEETGVSLPTIKNRVEKLKSAGVIKGFTVVIDPEKLIGGVTFFLSLKVRVSSFNEVIQKILGMEEVTGLYMTSGASDIFLKVSTLNLSSFHEFLKEKLGMINGIESVETFIIVKTLKEDYGPRLRPGFGVKTYCVYCGKEIKEEPVKLFLKDKELYFCCNSCLTLYKKGVTLN